YRQSVPLTSVEVINTPILIFKGGKADDISLNYPDDQVVWTRKQIKSASIQDSQLVFVGYGINAPERGWNDYAGIDVKNKTVVILVNDPGFATQDAELFNGNAMTYYGRWDYKFDEAARQGAAAAIIVHDTLPAAYPWATVSSSWTGPLFDMVRADKGSSLSSVEGWITKEKASLLFNKAGLNLEEMYQAAKTKGFKAIEMSLTGSASIENKIANVNSQNVVAMIKGSEAPDEIFLYMAHWDHLGTDPTIEGDGIYNGALDNATGTAGLLELAKAYASLDVKPKRSVLFLAVTAEEDGTLGSAYYAANPLYPLAKTVGGLNMDGLNNFGPTRDITVIGQGMSQLEEYLLKNAKVKNRVLNADAEAEKGYFYRSDHFELSKLGVPMLYPNSGYDHIEKGVAFGIEKANEYTAINYHRPSDEYHPSWDMRGAVEDLKLYFLTGHDIANSNDWPEWYEGTEFKAIRDSQRH
ncbi:MAG: peptidase M28, partial [Gammaproteobacteria bacterium]